MTPKLDSRLQNREPEPGLLNLPIPVPSIPILNPVITPLVGGADSNHKPPAPSPRPNQPPPPAPSPAPQPAQPAPPPPQSPSGGSNGGGSSSPGSGSGGGSPSGSDGTGGSPPQQNPGSDSSTPAPPADGSISVVGSSTFLVTPTGLVPKPENNAAAANAGMGPSSGDSNSSRHSSTRSSSSDVAPITLAGMPPSFTPAGGSNGANGEDPVDGTTGSTAGSHSHISGAAIGGIVISLLIVCIGVALLVLRRRHKRRKEDRRVEWINGYVAGADESGPSPEMLQRTSKHSSWGTPFEYRISEAFRRSVASSSSDGQDHNYVVSPPSPYHDFERSVTGAPVLPMPVHSPSQMRAHSPEDPFADATAQPLRRVSSLPLRISILSSASGHENPFSDQNAPPARTAELVPPGSAASSATFGPGTGNIEFPLPPPTSSSHRDTLLTPGIMISFPDSPISPSFAASGTSSYPRRATVQQTFTPASARRDEVRVHQGEFVNVVSVYEDGWAFVQREQDQERGLVPLTHLAM